MSHELFIDSELNQKLGLKEILARPDSEIEKAAHFILSKLLRHADKKTLPGRRNIKSNPRKTLPTLWFRNEKVKSDKIKKQDKINYTVGIDTHKQCSRSKFPIDPTYSLNHGQALGFAAAQSAIGTHKKGAMTRAINSIKNLNIPDGGGIENVNALQNFIIWIACGDFWSLAFQITKKSHRAFLAKYKNKILPALYSANPESIEIDTSPTRITFKILFD